MWYTMNTFSYFIPPRGRAAIAQPSSSNSHSSRSSDRPTANMQHAPWANEKKHDQSGCGLDAHRRKRGACGRITSAPARFQAERFSRRQRRQLRPGAGTAALWKRRRRTDMGWQPAAGNLHSHLGFTHRPLMLALLSYPHPQCFTTQRQGFRRNILHI